MAVPGFQEMMLPFLQICSDGQEHKVSEICEIIANNLKLTEEDKQETLSSGQTKLYNRIHWVKTYFGKSGLLVFPSRGKFEITQRGLDLLATKLSSINIKTLTQYPEFLEFQNKSNKLSDSTQEFNSDKNVTTPEESLENSYQTLREELSNNLLEIILKNTSSFFEQLVVDLLIAMGYGGSRIDAGQALGKTGDGGIDGIIKEDRLGLDIIYIQAKRYAADNKVEVGAIRDFTGSLDGHGAQKGVFITTSEFTPKGVDFVKKLPLKKIILIDGKKLTQLMIDFDIGVSTVATYMVKKVNMDYFDIE